MLSPIVVFAFNRVEEFRNLISSLRANPEAKDSELFVFLDGARENIEDDRLKINELKNIIHNIDGFKSVNYQFSNINKGLAKSIISGVTEVINKYGKTIVLEDDLYVSQSFLRFMNEMLDKFENDERVFQISGYSSKLRKYSKYNDDAYLNKRAQSWSWATWSNRWNTVDWKVQDYAELKNSPSMIKSFNSAGSDLFGMLRGYMEGRNNSWYIRFCYAMHKQGKYTVCPTKSLVRNDGFGGDATHCKNYDRYKIDFEQDHSGDFVVSQNIQPDIKLIKEAIRYWSIRYRIYGKLRTYLMRLK